MRTNVASSALPAATRNLTHEGTPAKRLTPLQELRRSVLGALLFESNYYESGQEHAARVAALIHSGEIAGAAIAALAIEAREKMKLRHMPLFIVREMARSNDAKTKQLVGETLARVIQRADELSEAVAIYWREKKQPLSAQYKKGLAAAFQKFDRFAISRYDRANAVRLRDVLFLCHAMPKDAEQEQLWKQLVAGELTAPDTWETALSATKGHGKREEWERLLAEKKVGGMALLRNLRNMQAAGVLHGPIREALAEMRTDRILPFRFIAAAKHAPQLEPELEAAMFRCLGGYPKLPGKTALVIDTSPSMWGAKVSEKSEMDRFEAAAALSMLAREICEDVAIYAFNERSYDIPPRRGFALRDSLAQTKGGYSRGGLAVARANAQGYDRIIVLTDGQWHYSHVVGYGEPAFGDAKVVAPAPLTERAYMLNVGTYRNGVGYGKWTEIDGFSEATLEFVRQSETFAD